MKTIFIETYGCAANQNNSEIISGLLTQSGNIITTNEELADIIIINSCVVKGKTEQKIKRRIQDLKPFAKKKNKLLIISGCMAQTNAKQLLKLNPNIIFLGTNHYKEISNLIKDHQENKLDFEKQDYYLSETKESKLNLPKLPINKLISIHQINEGCLGACSYCKTRLAKGKLHSYPIKDIIKSIESDLKQGAKEIWLTSQDTGAYGKDINADLPTLLKQIISIKHNFKLRLGMANPNHILPMLSELIEIYKSPKIYKFLHIPIQSASDKVLKDMNRFYKIKQVEEIITTFKKQFPHMVIATDIITAYPTETQKDHKANIEFIKDYAPQVFNISRFTKHKETPAQALKELSIKVAKTRATELMDAHKQGAKAAKEYLLKPNTKDKPIKVFVNKKLGQSLHQARDENYNLILIRNPDSKTTILGKTINVKITQLGIHHMIAESIRSQ
jgi:threonylcarbamoyladenosine tRNA methylthiotransferase CDKAL1